MADNASRANDIDMEQLWRHVSALETAVANLTLSLANVKKQARAAFTFDKTLSYNADTFVLGVNQAALNKDKMGGS